jgi:hypothetical protein
MLGLSLWAMMREGLRGENSTTAASPLRSTRGGGPGTG